MRRLYFLPDLVAKPDKRDNKVIKNKVNRVNRGKIKIFILKKFDPYLVLPFKNKNSIFSYLVSLNECIGNGNQIAA